MNNKNTIVSIILVLAIGGLLVLGINFDKITRTNTSNNNNQQQEEEQPGTTKEKTYTLTYNANGGSVTPTNKSLKEGSTYGELPIPAREGYTFTGWYTTLSLETKVSENTKINSDITIYAGWKKDSTPTPTPSPSTKTYTLTYNANGGSVTPTSKSLKEGSIYGELPIPIRSGYNFMGWYTKIDGDTKVTKDTKITSNTTIYAHWNKNTDPAPTNPTSISLNATSGTIYATGKVTLTATITPSNAKNKTITWSSSDTKVATVNKNGVVTGKKVGTATITAKTVNGKTATYKVTVRKVNIALIGNSKTYRGKTTEKSVSVLLSNMLKNRGISYNITVIAKGGSALIYKAEESPYKEKISANYDIAVLQEKTAYATRGNEYEQGLSKTIDLLKKANSKVKIYLREGYQVYDRTVDGVKQYFDTEQALANSRAKSLASKYNVYLIEDGSSFVYYKTQKKDVGALFDLEKKDTLHASIKGTYLVAACVYKNITSNNPENITYYASIGKSQAKYLLKIANKICK